MTMSTYPLTLGGGAADSEAAGWTLSHETFSTLQQLQPSGKLRATAIYLRGTHWASSQVAAVLLATSAGCQRRCTVRPTQRPKPPHPPPHPPPL